MTSPVAGSQGNLKLGTSTESMSKVRGTDFLYLLTLSLTRSKSDYHSHKQNGGGVVEFSVSLVPLQLVFH